MKIVIVEDEIRIREGLSKLIVKIDPGHIICGEAENGKEGLELILREKPDLIISDIRMPDMDGLEMLGIIKDRKIEYEAIFLTAYSEFSYAKTAISLGVSEYLLKPISVSELKGALDKVSSKLEGKQKERLNQTKTLGSLENIFTGLMIHNQEINLELEQFLKEQYGIAAHDKFILVPVYIGNSYASCHEQLKNELCYIWREQKEVKLKEIELPEYQMFAFVVYEFDDNIDLKRWFQNCMLLNYKKSNSVSIGWITGMGVYSLKQSLDTIRGYMHWNIVLGDNVIISYPQIESIKTEEITFPMDLMENVKSALCMRDMEKTRQYAGNFEEYYHSGKVLEPKIIKEHYMRFLWGILNVAVELDFIPFQNLNQQDLTEKIGRAVMKKELEQVVGDVLRMIDDKKVVAGSSVICKVKGLVHEYYSNGITLEEIARRLNLTPEYLGTLFRREEGINFNNYIKEYRIQKSKELLLGTKLKTYEVALKVGYTDSKYFSRVFKKLTGYLPAEYRRIKK
ncbi:response regulator transcription factor [Robinsoniella sp. KNHs210]|uniref:response regulator transcription factor n=1 Tax=Robinsoniella sp. KNHs210 TaxID=1469950 RepID=UPI00048711F5|nr:response regulator [Robinsoniella sp. KNHs210]